jgi:hypothetical protein
MVSNFLAVFCGLQPRALRALCSFERVQCFKIGQFSKDEKLTARFCHVPGGSLVSFLEALIKRSLEKEK